MADKHVPKHRAPKRTRRPRRTKPARARVDRPLGDPPPRADDLKFEHRNLDVDDRPLYGELKPTTLEVDPRSRRESTRAPDDLKDDWFFEQRPESAPNGGAPTSNRERNFVYPAESVGAGTGAEGDSDTIKIPQPVKSAGNQDWDPFFKDPDPPAGRLSRRKTDHSPKSLDAKPKKGRNAQSTTRERQEHQSLGHWFMEIIVLGLVAVLAAVLLTNYVVQAFFIPSESMENTLQTDDRVLVNKLTYRFRDPRPGDIVVFVSPDRDLRAPSEGGPLGELLKQVLQGLGLQSSIQDLIKRVVAVEGQTVEVRIGSVFIDGEMLSEPYLKELLPIPDFAPVQVPEGHVFVMGDNRLNSLDSRSFGPVPVDTVVGRAFALIWPLDRFTRFTS